MINLYPSLPSIGPSDPSEVVELTIFVRRRRDHPPFHEHVQRHEFVAKHGYHPNDHAAVLSFLATHHLTAIHSDPASKQIEVIGTVQDAGRAFGVTFNSHQHPTQGVVRVHSGEPVLIDEIIAVSGLTTVRGLTTPHFAITPANTNALTIDQLKTLYSWPTNAASGQVIAIYEDANAGGHSAADVALYFSHTGDTAPTLINVMPSDATTLGLEANLDIMVAGSAAPGCTIAMYYSPTINTGNRVYLDPLTRMIHPLPGDPNVTVISISYGFFNNGNDTDLSDSTLHNALQSLFQDAAALGISVLASAGDNGTGLAAAEFNNPSNGFAYVVEPGCNPYSLCIGGTVVGNIVGSSFEEYVWNTGDTFHATGGGVSQFFGVPSYQANLTPSPVHINTGSPGRGMPDISGNASGASGVSIPANGVFETIGGTSLTAPLMAGLLAVINASSAMAGRLCGMVHPIIYNPANVAVFRDITAATLGPPNNATGGAPGYPAATGWDGCSGLGIPIGTALQTAIVNATASNLALSFSTDGVGSTSIAAVQAGSFAFTHPPISSAGGHFINVFPTSAPTASVVNNFSVTTPGAPGPVSTITPTAAATSIALEWLTPPVLAQGPFTYLIQWGNSPSTLNNSNVSAVPSFTIPGLVANQTVFGAVTARGPTGLSSTAVTFQAATQNTSAVVTNIGAYFNFVGNFMTGIQWDDVGATQYFIDYSTSSSGPWITTNASPWPTGFGATSFTGNGSSMFPVCYPANTINSLHGGVINVSTGFCTVFTAYWVRIRAQYSNGTITTSAPFQNAALSQFGVGYPTVDGAGPTGAGCAVCQSNATGRLDIQWDDCYPAIWPQDGSAIHYQVRLTVAVNGSSTFGTVASFGPLFTTGFGYLKASKPGALTGSFNTITGIPAGTYLVGVAATASSGALVNSTSGSTPVDSPSTATIGGTVYPVVVIH